MAKTIGQWIAEIKARKESVAALSGLTSTSNVAEWKLWQDIGGWLAHAVDSLFDNLKIDIDAAIAADKSHTLKWYVTKAKAFQYGVTLPADTDVYAVVPPEDEAVLIVSSAAAVELTSLNRVRIKVAKGAVGELEALSEGELEAFTTYMGRIKDAGVRLQCTSGDADELRLKLNIYYDPLVIDAAGERLDGTDAAPVKGAINAFLSALPFDGVFILNDMIDAVEATDGIKICHVEDAQANYAATPYVPVPVKYTPDAGYMVIDEVYFDLNVTYIPG